MFSATDPIFGNHAAAISVWSQRNEVLASNIANADTPNYKARDIDFKSVLAGTAQSNLSMTTTNAGHLPMDASFAADQSMLYRMPSQPSLDGNTVESDVEQAEFSKNALRYQASLRFINGRVSSLRAAISGGHQ